MCGIYGVVGTWRDPAAGLNAIRRRGPDQRAHWQDETAGVWLGHARLSIIDLSPAGAQPMMSPDGGVVMIYNGEIYNYRELRAELEAAGETFVGHSDSEVLLRLFVRDGAAAFSRLNGIFAAAFWDRATDTLTLVRDPMGVKPLYVASGGGRVAFSSELKALVRAGDVATDLNPAAVLHHIGLIWSPGRGTILKGVEKLLPGEVMEMRDGATLRRWTYSDPALPLANKPATVDVATATRDVAAAVETAVTRQLVADVPLGSFLSGGLDSSAIAAFAVRHRDGPGKLQCFTIDLDARDLGGEGFAEDLPYARRVADHLGVDLHIVGADASMADRLAEMVYLLDEPTADFAALNTLLIAELARAQGITVLLSGSGGDDIFTGYRRHFALMQERYWAWLPAALRKGMTAATGALPREAALGRRVAKAFENAGLGADQRLAGYFNWLPPQEAVALLAPAFRAQIDAGTMAAPLIETLARVPEGATVLDRMLYLECRHFLVDHNLNYADKMGMAAGIETRVPFLDPDLVRLAMRLPDTLKQRGRVGKWILKKAMEPHLPLDVIYRPKTGFGVPLRAWLQGPLAPLVRDKLSPESIARRGIFDAANVTALIADTAAGRRDGSYTILALLCLELWCQQYLDGRYSID